MLANIANMTIETNEWKQDAKKGHISQILQWCQVEDLYSRINEST